MLRWERFGRGSAKYLLSGPLRLPAGTATSAHAYVSRLRFASSYLQNSVLPTMHFQASLPRLPVPKLEDTQQRYLDAQKPFLTPEEYDRCKEVTENFIAYEGRALNAQLVENDKKNSHTSYISEPWFDMYLKYRDSIVLNHNPYIVMKEDPTTTDQLNRATKFIHTSLKFKRSLDDSVLEPDVYHLNPRKSDTKLFRQVTRLLPSRISWYGAYLFKAFPLDMSQYGRLFNSSRIPKLGKDMLFTDENAKHILVLKNGHYYVFDVFKEDGTILSLDEIYCNLKYINEQGSVKAEHSLGALTAEKRNTWASIREELELDPSNADSLKLIDGALFALCLDDKECNNESDGNEMFLYGNPDNRWFDKSFQLIMSKNAQTAIQFEHAWGDGVAVMRYFNELCLDTKSYTYATSQENHSHGVRQLTFNLSPSLISSLDTAKENHQLATSRLSFSARKMEEFGKNFFKSEKVSPDAMFQLAIQMAQYRLSGRAVPTYESCSTAAFKHGRTETIRPASVATVACSEAFDKSHPAKTEEIAELLRKQSNYHSKLTREAAMGQGFDRHLFGLKITAEKMGKTVDFFNDQAYQNINQIVLSTSTVYSPNVSLGGFAPVTPKGLGIGYMVEDDWIGCNITSYPDSPNGSDFIQLVFDSLHDIHTVLSGQNVK